MSMRLDALKAKLEKETLRALLISDKKNIFYLSGLKVTAGFILVCDSVFYLLVDFRYTEKAQKEADSTFEVIEFSGNVFKTVNEILKKHKIRKIAFEGDNLTFNEHKALSDSLNAVRTVSVRGFVQSLRMIKDKGEILKLKKSIALNDFIFTEIEKLILVNENIKAADIADFAFCMMQQENAMGEAFDAIVAFNKDTSLPHAGISRKNLRKQGVAMIDYGVVWRNYHSDLTRTYYKGKETDKFKEIYNIVSEAQMKAIEAIKPGVRLGDIDKTARDFINKYGYGDKFGHSLGHGVGLDIHEYPHVHSKNDTLVEEGMVFTVEPGIYLSGCFGVRIEDIIMVTQKGTEILSKAPKVIKYI